MSGMTVGAGSVIKSIQRGNTVGWDVTISAVNMAKSVATFSGFEGGDLVNNPGGSTMFSRVELLNSTTVRCKTGSTPAATTSWQVVEYF